MHPFRSLANELGKSGFIFEPAKVRLAERDSFNTKGKWDRHTNDILRSLPRLMARMAAVSA